MGKGDEKETILTKSNKLVYVQNDETYRWTVDFKWKCVTSYYISFKTCNLIPNIVFFFSSSFFLLFVHSDFAQSTLNHFCHGKSWFCVCAGNQFNSCRCRCRCRCSSSFGVPCNVYLMCCCCCTFSVYLDYNLLDNWACIHILCKQKWNSTHQNIRNTYNPHTSKGYGLCVLNGMLQVLCTYTEYRNKQQRQGESAVCYENETQERLRDGSSVKSA